jgi:hypothetical protein
VKRITTNARFRNGQVLFRSRLFAVRQARLNLDISFSLSSKQSNFLFRDSSELETYYEALGYTISYKTMAMQIKDSLFENKGLAKIESQGFYVDDLGYYSVSDSIPFALVG